MLTSANSFAILQGMFVSSMCSQGPEISNGPKERHTLMKFLPATGWENMKRLLSFAAPFIKLCINPSSGAIAANVRMYDEENRLTLDQGNELASMGPNDSYINFIAK